jgi:ubiquinone/menaquinone biosynthesis C-methylase UbiE
MPDSSHEHVVQESFRKQVEKFGQARSVYAHGREAVSWAGPLDESMIALEVACGAAHAAESLAPFVHQVVGMDLTQELIDLGAERLRKSGISNVLLQRGNAEALPFVAGSFDIVVCRGGAHHFADASTAVMEMERVAKPGGRIVLIDLVAPSDVEPARFDEVHRLLDPSHVHASREDQLGDPFSAGTSIGSVSTSLRRIPIDVVMTPSSDRDGIMAELRSELAGGKATGLDPAEEDGRIVASFRYCTLHANTAAI